MDEHYQREEELFTAALAQPPGERAAFLASACADDDALRKRIEALLREHDEPVSLLDAPPERELADAARAGSGVDLATDAAGMKVGRYQLLEKIGEGGCGVVYRATQTEPVRREVALKIIKLGMDTREVIARFEAERQALALMEHPAIARAFDAGATDTGRPFFVMELVRGTKITDYCDRHRLRPEDRLRLFAQVCAAVQHAHQKGVIHRDLKPSNILVASHDGVAMPKVIDFGIAKATQGRLTDRTLFTALDQFIGTPAYMSPEQAELNAPDVDTRSDIYSLGVLLYELLTGRTPLEAAELRQAGVDEVRRRIREEEPLRPSARLRTLDHVTLTQAAACRQIEPPKLVHLVSGDLDWIVMRCLEKDRTRRYETANALTHEIERYLAHEPVSARPPSGAYVLGKLIRRHRFGFAAGGAVALALLAGIAVSTRLYFRERTALKEAEANAGRAEIEAARSAEVARFMRDMLKGVAPAVAQGRDTTLLRQILAATAPRLGELEKQPEVQADLRMTLGQVYFDVDEVIRAGELFTAALLQRRSLHGDLHLKTAEALHWLGQAHNAQSKWADGLKYHREAVEIVKKNVGAKDPALLLPLDGLGTALFGLWRSPEALVIFQEELAIARQMPGNNKAAIVRALFGVGQISFGTSKYGEAEAAFRECLSLYPEGETMDGQFISKNVVLYALGDTLWRRSQQEPARAPEAEAVFRESLAFERRFLGEQNPQTPKTLNRLASLLTGQRRFEAAITVIRDLVALDRKRLEREPTNLTAVLGLSESLKNLGATLYGQGRFVEAELPMQESVAGLRAGLASSPARSNFADAKLVEALVVYGGVLIRLQRLPEAEDTFREALALFEPAPGWNVIRLAAGLHRSLALQGKVAEVEAAWSRFMDSSRAKQEGPNTTIATGLITAMLEVGRNVQAEAFARENLALWEKRRPDDWHVFAFRTQIGNALVGQGKFAEAEPLLLSGCVGLRERITRIPTQVGRTLLFPYQYLDRLYTVWGKPEQAAVWRAKQQEILSTTQP